VFAFAAFIVKPTASRISLTQLEATIIFGLVATGLSLFQIHDPNGPAVRDKGMAIFQRKINRLYAMLGREDYENLYLMFCPNPCCSQHCQ
jgi:hypothetical protein